jgi:hypothetical protein
MKIVQQRAQRTDPAAKKPAQEHREEHDRRGRPEQGDDAAGPEHGGCGGQRIEPEEQVLAAGQLIGAGRFRAAEEPEEHQQQRQLGRSPPPPPGNPQQPSHGAEPIRR